MVLRKAAARFVVLGGAGAIGRIIVRGLFESHPKNQVKQLKRRGVLVVKS